MSSLSPVTRTSECLILKKEALASVSDAAYQDTFDFTTTLTQGEAPSSVGIHQGEIEGWPELLGRTAPRYHLEISKGQKEREPTNGQFGREATHLGSHENEDGGR